VKAELSSTFTWNGYRCPHDGDCQIDTESLPLDHCGKRVWISRIITATKDEHYGPYSALHAFPVKFFTPVDLLTCWPIATSLLYSFVIHCIVYLNYYSIVVKLYDIYHIVIHTFVWELHSEKYRIECGRSRVQRKDYKIDMCCFSVNHAALRWKSKE